MKHKLLAVAACVLTAATTLGSTGGATMPLQLTSTKFTRGAEIPTMYTCEGQNVSPPLSWSDAPPGTKAFALVVDDPDAPDPKAPTRDFIHWVIYNMPASTRGLAEGIQNSEVPTGAAQGKNDMGKIGYGGPCPSVGRHRYVFTIYALDAMLQGLRDPSKADLLKAMEGHILGKAELVGTYEKQHK
jgi:Raf kinase inhibitor-like YbhB/YbcL family protein